MTFRDGFFTIRRKGDERKSTCAGSEREGAPQIDMDHVHLPDPIREHIVALERRVSELEEQMHNHYGTTVFKEDIQDDADL